MANANIQNFLNAVEALILQFAVGKVSHDASATWTATRTALENAAVGGAAQEMSDIINQAK